MKRTTSNPLFFDPGLEVKRLTEFIKRTCYELKYHGGVIGLSGGVDSSVCAYLMVEALGSKNVLGIAIPSADSDTADEKDARKVAELLDIEFIVHPLTPLLEHFGVYDYIRELGPVEEIKQKYYVKADTPMPAHIAYPCIMKLRGRMLILTHHAKRLDSFMCQTIDKTELKIGFFDKFGDMVGDIAPIYHLYKSQVKELGRYFGLPPELVNRPAGSGNFPVTDEEELGLTIEEADSILHLLEDTITLKNTPKSIAKATGIPINDVTRIRDLVRNTESKRIIPIGVESTYQ